MSFFIYLEMSCLVFSSATPRFISCAQDLEDFKRLRVGVLTQKPGTESFVLNYKLNLYNK